MDYREENWIRRLRSSLLGIKRPRIKSSKGIEIRPKRMPIRTGSFARNESQKSHLSLWFRKKYVKCVHFNGILSFRRFGELAKLPNNG